MPIRTNTGVISTPSAHRLKPALPNLRLPPSSTVEDLQCFNIRNRIDWPGNKRQLDRDGPQSLFAVTDCRDYGPNETSKTTTRVGDWRDLAYYIKSTNQGLLIVRLRDLHQ